MNDVHTGRIIQSIAQDMSDSFRSHPALNEVAARLYGSIASAAVTGEVERKATYDLDVSFILPSLNGRYLGPLHDFFDRISKKYSAPGYKVVTSFLQGPIKLTEPGEGQILLLHVMMNDRATADTEKPYVWRSIMKHGVMVHGEFPDCTMVERIGIMDVLPEASKRIGRIFLKQNVNWEIDENGKREVHRPYTGTDMLEYATYSIVNNAVNIVEAFSPYCRNAPHFENRPVMLEEFRRLFPQHPWNGLPLELMALRNQSRKGIPVSQDGVDTAAANFLAFNDQMLRNIVGDFR